MAGFMYFGQRSSPATHLWATCPGGSGISTKATPVPNSRDWISQAEHGWQTICKLLPECNLVLGAAPLL